MRENGPERWSDAAKIITGRSGKQIRERWLNTLNPKLKKGHWDPKEEQALIKLVMKFGPKWSKLVGFFEGRTENSIKNRLYCILRKVANEKRKAGDIDAKYLDPEGKELQCSTDALLDFQQEALDQYISDVFDLPTNIDLEKPIVLVSEAQKRFKTGNQNEQYYNASQSAQEYPPVPSSYNTRQSGPNITLRYPGIGTEIAQNPYKYNPAIDFPTYTKNTPHLNELSKNIQNRQVPHSNSFRNLDELSHLQLGPYSGHNIRESAAQVPVESINRTLGHSGTISGPHFSRITGPNAHIDVIRAVVNDQKQSPGNVFRNTRNNVRFKIEPKTD